VKRKPEKAKAYAKPSGAALPAGLIAWWPGDGHADDVVGNHHGVPINGADYAPGLIGQAFRVNGTNQHFSVAHSPSLSFSTNEPYTLEAWVYRTGGTPDFHMLGKRDRPSGCYYQLVSGPEVPLNEWWHRVNTSDGKIIRLYQNGVLVRSGPAPCPGPNFADFRIGTVYVYYTFAGLIDEVRIYNRALTQTEIKANYDAGRNAMTGSSPATTDPQQQEAKNMVKPAGVGLTTGLIAWWPGNGDARDYAGTNHGTLAKGAAFGAGKLGQAFALAGNGSYVQAPSSPLWSFGSKPFTIALWAKFGSARGGQALVACDEGPGTRNKWIFWFSDGGVRLDVCWAKEGGGYSIGNSFFAPILNQWYHLAVTRQPTQYVFFINGKAVSANTDNRPLPHVTAPLTIGSAEGGFCLNGLIDDVRIYNRALDPSELAAIYAGTYTGAPIRPARNFPATPRTN
jgi:hypothetical protein